MWTQDYLVEKLKWNPNFVVSLYRVTEETFLKDYDLYFFSQVTLLFQSWDRCSHLT